MNELTLGVSVLFSILVVRARPGTAIGLVFMLLMIWPEFLRLPIGPANMSAVRLVAIVLLIRLVIERRAIIPWSAVDRLVLFVWIWTVFATWVAAPGSSQLNTMIGRSFDTVLIYFVARYAFTNTDDAKALIAPLALTAYAMGILSLIESVTTFTPFESLRHHIGWSAFSRGELQFRLGFLRAQASATHPISFGVAMVAIGGVIWALRDFAASRWSPVRATAASALAVIATLSSSPWVAGAVLFVFSLFCYRPQWIRPVLVIVLILGIGVEIASNRHFYHLIDYLALDARTAWYRTRLVETAFAQWHEFWLFGSGASLPHHWGELIDRRKHIDVVNFYVLIALYGGVLALLAYIASHVIAIRGAVKAWRVRTDPRIRRLCFGLAATLLALDFAGMSVSFFGAPLIGVHLVLGLLVSASGNTSRTRSPR